MLPSRLFRRLGALLMLAALIACEDPPKVAASLDAGAKKPEAAAPTVEAPKREGCSRVGSLEYAETDPSCILRTLHVSEEMMRATMKQVTITPTLEPEDVIAGSSGVFHITIKNTSSSEALVAFEAKTRLPGPRTDWSRVVGVPEPKTVSDTPKLFFPISTTDSYNREVDALPTVSEGATPVAPTPTVLGVYLRPGGKLTHTALWWALRIPAPAPMYQDDAGHRFYPKTAATPLLPAEYNIIVDLPLYALSREERKLSHRVKVIRTRPEAGP